MNHIQGTSLVGAEERTLLELRVLVGSEHVGLEVWGRDSGGLPHGGEVFWLPVEHKERLLRAVAAFGEIMDGR